MPKARPGQRNDPWTSSRKHSGGSKNQEVAPPTTSVDSPQMQARKQGDRGGPGSVPDPADLERGKARSRSVTSSRSEESQKGAPPRRPAGSRGAESLTIGVVPCPIPDSSPGIRWTC